MKEPIVFPYKTYKNHPCPIIKITLYGPDGSCDTEAYVDSGASISIFSLVDAQRIGINYVKGKKTYFVVGDSSLIPVYLHRFGVKIASVDFKATIGFSPRLGVGFNLIGRKDFFNHFDITFSDSRKMVIFLPAK